MIVRMRANDVQSDSITSMARHMVNMAQSFCGMPMITLRCQEIERRAVAIQQHNNAHARRYSFDADHMILEEVDGIGTILHDPDFADCLAPSMLEMMRTTNRQMRAAVYRRINAVQKQEAEHGRQQATRQRKA